MQKLHIVDRMECTCMYAAQYMEKNNKMEKTSLAWLQAIQTATAIANMHMIKLMAMAAWTEISVASGDEVPVDGDEVSVDWKASGHAPGRSTRQDLQNESSSSSWMLVSLTRLYTDVMQQPATLVQERSVLMQSLLQETFVNEKMVPLHARKTLLMSSVPFSGKTVL